EEAISSEEEVVAPETADDTVEAEVETTKPEGEATESEEVSDGPEEEVIGVTDDGRASRTPWIVGGAIAALVVAALAIWKYQPEWFGMERNGQEMVSHTSTPPDEADVVAGTAGPDSSAVDTVTVDTIPQGTVDGTVADSAVAANAPQPT